MQPRDFVERWAAEVRDEVDFVTYGELIAGAGVSDPDLQLLQEVGLPTDAAPFLSFMAGPGMLASAREHQDLQHLDAMAEIGFNGSGDPVCIDCDRGHVVYLNHDLEFLPVFINSSILGFARCLLAVNSRIVQIGERRGSFIDSLFTPEEANELLATIQQVDPPCAQPGTFWAEEISNLTA